MLYFADIKNKAVYTENNQHIGKLTDLFFLSSDKPQITKIQITKNSKQPLLIPIEYLKRVNNHIIIYQNYHQEPLLSNELSLANNLLDRQIIDIKGRKVVRVNDILIQDKNGCYIAGVDTSLLAVWRWFNLENLILKLFRLFNIESEPEILPFSEIQTLDLGKDKLTLNRKVEKLKKIHPADLADYLEKTNVHNINKVVNFLDQDFAVQVVGNLNINFQTAFFRYIKEEKAAKIISLLDPDEAVDILLTLSPRRKDLIIKLLTWDKKKEIEYLLNLSQTTIGALISSEFLTVSPNETARKVLEKVRSEAINFSFLNSIYVCNNQKQLVGVFNLHELIMQPPDTLVYKFMRQDVVAINLATTEKTSLKKMFKYKISALPVINKHKQLLGIVNYDRLGEYYLKHR